MVNALLEIIIMLVVSAGLGFAIAWFIQKSKLDKLQVIYNKQVSDYNDLTQQHNDLKSKMDVLKLDIIKVRTDLEKSETDLAAANSEIEKHAKTITMLQDEGKTLRADLEEANLQHEKTKAELETVTNQLNEGNE